MTVPQVCEWCESDFVPCLSCKKAVREIERLRVSQSYLHDRWSAGVEDRAELRAEVERLRSRLRETCQILVEAVGASGPCNAEDAARRLVARDERLRAEVAQLKAHMDDAGGWCTTIDGDDKQDQMELVRRAPR